MELRFDCNLLLLLFFQLYLALKLGKHTQRTDSTIKLKPMEFLMFSELGYLLGHLINKLGNIISAVSVGFATYFCIIAYPVEVKLVHTVYTSRQQLYTHYNSWCYLVEEWSICKQTTLREDQGLHLELHILCSKLKALVGLGRMLYKCSFY